MIRPFDFDVFCLGKKFLVFNLVSRDLKIKYRRSFLGFFWTILHPLILSGVYYFVFKRVFRIEIPHYIAFILSGILPWNYFATSITEGTEALIVNSGLLTKVPIPTQVFPLVISISNFATFILALFVVAACSLLSGVAFQPSLFYLPLLCMLLFFMTYSISIILCVTIVYLRDLKHALGLLLQIWFYSTPVLYEQSMIPVAYRNLIYLNPVGPLLISFHSIFTGKPVELINVINSSVWATLLFLVAVPTHKHFSRRVIERL